MQKRLKNPAVKDAAEFVFAENARIGYGTTSEVFLGTNEKNGEIVAIKVISKERLPEEVWRTESKAHKLVNNHPNVLRVYDRFQSAKNFYLITEYCPERDLRKILTERKNKPMEESKALKILAGLTNAVEHVHNHGMIHRDIKVENVLFKDGQPKLADLGSVTFKEKCNDYVGTEGNLAPEVILLNDENETFYGKEADIWSLGILFHELLYGKRPFDHLKPSEAREMIIKTNFEAPKDGFVSEETRDLLTRMLTRDPAKRITIKQMKELDLIKKHYKEEEALISMREKITEMIMSDEKYKAMLGSFSVEIKSNPQSKSGFDVLFHESSKN